MVNALVVGMAMLASSGGASPTVGVNTTYGATRAVYTVSIPDAATTPQNSLGPLSERSRAPWRSTALPAAKAPAAKRHSTVEKIIGVAAGICVGWVVGGAIGGYAMDKGPEADGAVITGVMIGAPIGATIGGILGYQMTKK